jgi:hypothetical protein
MPDRNQADALGEDDLVLFALVCLAAMRAGVLQQAELLQIDEAVCGLQLLAERDDVADLDSEGTVARMAAVWQHYGPGDRAFRPEWVAILRSEQRALGDALALATATVNYWERGPAR